MLIAFHLFQFKSHLILSAFALNELPNLKTRLDTLQTLWKKCDGYLVLIENGTNAGFKLIEEARAFILQQTENSYIFAPVKSFVTISSLLYY